MFNLKFKPRDMTKLSLCNPKNTHTTQLSASIWKTQRNAKHFQINIYTNICVCIGKKEESVANFFNLYNKHNECEPTIQSLFRSFAASFCRLLASTCCCCLYEKGNFLNRIESVFFFCCCFVNKFPISCLCVYVVCVRRMVAGKV